MLLVEPKKTLLICIVWEKDNNLKKFKSLSYQTIKSSLIITQIQIFSLHTVNLLMDMEMK